MEKLFISEEKKSYRIGRVYFINVQRAAFFTHADPESAKKTVKLSVFFAL